MYRPREQRACRMPTPTITAIILCMVLCKAGTILAGVPLPDVCWGKRGDKELDISGECADEDKVHRYVFNSARHLRCKKFSLCPEPATNLDEQISNGAVLNYFQDREDCEQECTNVVECFLEPLLEIENGYPVVLTGEGEGERLGYGAKVGFACNESYRLVAESIRVCQLNGTWNGTQPHCEIQCPKPEVGTSVSLSPLQLYYNVGQKVQVDCMDGMDGNASWTCKGNGTWEGPDPTCSPSCAPPIIDNAHPPEMELVGSSIVYTYQCNEGYWLLHNSSTLHCINGQLHGDIPFCTRVQITKEGGMSLNIDNGTFYFNVVKGAANRVLICGLDGAGEQDYNVSWTLPTKPNGEVLPGVTSNRDTLTFSTAVPEQDGEYICTTAGKNTSVIVNVITNTVITPPMVDYFFPEGVFTSPPGATTMITSFTTGSQPLHVTWTHNGSEVVNLSTINNTQFTVQQIDDLESEAVLSNLIINGVGAVAQGAYKIVVNNDAGQDESQEAQLMLDQQSGGRDRREAEVPFCNDDPRKVVLVGIVRRTGTTSSGLRTIRLRVDKVLHGDADGISHHSSVEVRIFTGTNDISRLHRGQKVILSGVSRGKIVYMFNSPVEDYSSSLEKAIVDC